MIKYSQRYTMYSIEEAFNWGHSDNELSTKLALLIQSKLIVIPAALRCGMTGDLSDMGLTSKLIDIVYHMPFPALTDKTDKYHFAEFYENWQGFIFETFVNGAADHRWFRGDESYDLGMAIIDKLEPKEREKLIEQRIDDYCEEHIIFSKDVVDLCDEIRKDNVKNNRKSKRQNHI